MFVVNGFFKVYALLFNFLSCSKSENIKMDFELRDSKKDELEFILKEELKEEFDRLKEESARRYFSRLADKNNAIKKIFKLREPVSTIKTKNAKKRRIPGRAIFDCDMNKLTKNFSSVDVGELVAYMDENLQETIYAIVYASANYRPKGEKNKIVLYELIVGCVGDQVMVKKGIVSERFYKFSKDIIF